MTPSATNIWLPDLIFTGKSFQSGLALVADAQGRIVRLSRDPADFAAARRLPNRAMLPGLVNAHSHAFHRVIRGRTEYRAGEERDTFWTWREMMFRAAISLDPDDLYTASRMAFLEMALAGITTVGEFHYLHRDPEGNRYADPNEMALAVVRAARDVGLRICLLHCAYARAGWRRTASIAQRRFIIRDPGEYLDSYASLRSALAEESASGLAWTGYAPHSVRAIPPEYLRAILPAIRGQPAPVHMHVSEQTDENEACLAEHDTTPLGLLEHEGLLHPGFTAVHAIHVASHEVGALARAGSQVCACPTTERSLGDGTSPADTLTHRGVRIALGTDTNVEINLFADARALECHLRLKHLHRNVLAPAPQVGQLPDPAGLASELLAHATRDGARSLHAPGGEFTPGRAADFCTVSLDDPTIAGIGADSLPAALVFSADRTCIRDVVVGGKAIVEDGRHPLQGAIINDFRELQLELWSLP